MQKLRANKFYQIHCFWQTRNNYQNNKRLIDMLTLNNVAELLYIHVGCKVRRLVPNPEERVPTARTHGHTVFAHAKTT